MEFNVNNVARFSAHKPAFEVGSSSQLSFAKPAVWSLSDSLVDDQVELVDEDDLLDADDFNKPDAESLRGYKYMCRYIFLTFHYFLISCYSVWNHW